jgi:hypothetical protein
MLKVWSLEALGDKAERKICRAHEAGAGCGTEREAGVSRRRQECDQSHEEKVDNATLNLCTI